MAGTGWDNSRPDPHLFRARRSRASGAAVVGGLGERAPLPHAARADRRDAALRRFRARTIALQRTTWDGTNRRPTLMDTLHNVLRPLQDAKGGGTTGGPGGRTALNTGRPCFPGKTKQSRILLTFSRIF